MAIRRQILSLLWILGVVACSNSAESPGDNIEELLIDPSIRYQAIDGFGGFGGKIAWWKKGPYFDEAFTSQLINELGVTILRDTIPISFEPENDNNDPYVLDLKRFNLTEITKGADSALEQHFAYLSAMHRAGLDKLIVSIWSPPLWMKYNQKRGNGTASQGSAPPYDDHGAEIANQLKPSLYEEFAEYCVAYIRLLKQHTSIDLYAVSVQNEPRFSQFYASAVYSPQALAELIAVVGARFEKEGINTRIFAPEDVMNVETINAYMDAILLNPEASRHTDIFAIHNYINDGINPGNQGPESWRNTYTKARQAGKRLWMTETSGFDIDSMWGGMELALSIYNALYYGNVSAWLFWQMSDDGGRPLLLNSEPTWLYDVSRHFYRHVRVGDKRIEAVTNSGDLPVLAFYSEIRRETVLILINPYTSDRMLKLPSAELYRGWITGPMARYSPLKIDQDTGRGVVSIPSTSIVTVTMR